MRTKQNALKLIKALRKAANLLESGEADYTWSSSRKCNCGILALCLLDKKTYATVPEQGGEWTEAVNRHLWEEQGYSAASACTITGMKMVEVVETLLKNGMEAADFNNLEYLNDRQVIKKAKLHPIVDHQNKDTVIKYMRAWADILCKQQCRRKKYHDDKCLQR